MVKILEGEEKQKAMMEATEHALVSVNLDLEAVARFPKGEYADWLLLRRKELESELVYLKSKKRR